MTDPPSDEESSEARRLVHVALDKVLEAWLFFDRKNAGFLRKSEVTEALVSFEADSKGHEGRLRDAHPRQVRGDGLGQVTAGVLPGVSPRRGGMGGIGRGRRRVIRT